MKVSELIVALERYDQSADVVIASCYTWKELITSADRLQAAHALQSSMVCRQVVGPPAYRRNRRIGLVEHYGVSACVAG
jgi:hypothetical protein